MAGYPCGFVKRWREEVGKRCGEVKFDEKGPKSGRTRPFLTGSTFRGEALKGRSAGGWRRGRRRSEKGWRRVTFVLTVLADSH